MKTPDGENGSERLHASRWFRHFDSELSAKLSIQLERVVLSRGEVLFRQGDRGDAMYVVLDGCLRAFIAQDDGSEVNLGEMGPGASVGEIQVLTGGRRSATVAAVRDSELVRIPTASFDRMARASPEMRRELAEVNRQRLNRSLLAEVLPDLVGPLDEEALEYIESLVEFVELKHGETLFEQNAPGDSLYVLLRGRLAAVLVDEAGKERLVGEMARGEFVGEMAVITGEPRSTGVRAIRDSLLLQASRENFELIATRYPQALKAITRLLIGRLSKVTRMQAAAPTASRVKTVALVPLSGEVPVEDLGERLRQALAAFGTTLLLSRERLEEVHGIKISSSPGGDDPAEMRLTAWLDEMELRYRFILYVADAEPSAWQRRCLRQADEILLLAPAGEPSGTAEMRLLLHAERGEEAELRTSLVLLHPDGARRPRDTGLWLAELAARRHHHLRQNRPADVERLARFLAGRAVGLALGGGGARAFAHIGVLQALEDAGIAVDLVGGTSLGALIAAMLAVGFAPASMVERSRQAFIAGKAHRALTPPFISILSAERGERLAGEMFLNLEVEDLWLPYFAISANLTTAHQVIHRSGPVADALRASMAVPGVLPPALSGHDLLVDGGLLNNVPGDVARRLCGGRVISVDVSSKAAFEIDSPTGRLPSGWSILWSRFNPLTKIEAPNILEILVRSSTLTSVQNVELAKAEADLYLRPPVEEFGMFKMNDLDRIVDISYEYTKGALKGWAG